MYKADEEITIEEDLNSSEMEIKNIHIECVFTDADGNKHSRLFQMDTVITDLSKIDVKSALGKDEILNKFK
jgi:hypothetical protein|tara:strand:+ start:222 stop:434 length:213 start_codon:yes stop_codon:yes gene_type:complete